jgi:hypothetical protein
LSFGLGNTEVQQHLVALGHDERVAGLEVAVDDEVGMRLEEPP